MTSEEELSNPKMFNDSNKYSNISISVQFTPTFKKPIKKKIPSRKL